MSTHPGNHIGTKKSDESFHTPNSSTHSIRFAGSSNSASPIIPLMKLTNPQFRKTMTSYNYTQAKDKQNKHSKDVSNPTTSTNTQQNQRVSPSQNKNIQTQKVSQPNVTTTTTGPPNNTSVSTKRSFQSPIPPLNVINGKPLHKKPKFGKQRTEGLYGDDPVEQSVSDNALLRMLKSNSIFKRRSKGKKPNTITPPQRIMKQKLIESNTTKSQKTLFVSDETESTITSTKKTLVAVEPIADADDHDDIREISADEANRTASFPISKITPVQRNKSMQLETDKQTPVRMEKSSPIHTSRPVSTNKMILAPIKPTNKANSDQADKATPTPVDKLVINKTTKSALGQTKSLTPSKRNEVNASNSSNMTTPLKPRSSPFQISKITPVHLKRATPNQVNNPIQNETANRGSMEPQTTKLNDHSIATPIKLNKPVIAHESQTGNDGGKKNGSSKNLSLSCIKLRAKDFYGHNPDKNSQTPAKENLTEPIEMKSLPIHSSGSKLSTSNFIQTQKSQTKSTNTSTLPSNERTPTKSKEDTQQQPPLFSLPLSPHFLLSNSKHRKVSLKSPTTGERSSQELDLKNNSANPINNNSSTASTQIAERVGSPKSVSKEAFSKDVQRQLKNDKEPIGTNFLFQSTQNPLTSDKKVSDVENQPKKQSNLSQENYQTIGDPKQLWLRSNESTGKIDNDDKGGNIFNNSNSEIQTRISIDHNQTSLNFGEITNSAAKADPANTSLREPEVSEININSIDSGEENNVKNSQAQKDEDIIVTKDDFSDSLNNKPLNGSGNFTSLSTNTNPMYISNLLNAKESKFEIPPTSESQSSTAKNTHLESVSNQFAISGTGDKSGIPSNKPPKESQSQQNIDETALTNPQEENKEDEAEKPVEQDTQPKSKNVKKSVEELIKTLGNPAQLISDNSSSAHSSNIIENIKNKYVPNNFVIENCSQPESNTIPTATQINKKSPESDNIKVRLKNYISSIDNIIESENKGTKKRKHTSTLKSPDNYDDKKRKPTLSEPKLEESPLPSDEKLKKDMLEEAPVKVISLQNSFQNSIGSPKPSNEPHSILTDDSPLVSTEKHKELLGMVTNIFQTMGNKGRESPNRNDHTEESGNSKFQNINYTSKFELENNDSANSGLKASVVEIPPDLKKLTSNQLNTSSTDNASKMEVINISDSDEDSNDTASTSKREVSKKEYFEEEIVIPDDVEELEEESDFYSSSFVDPYEERKKFERNFSVYANEKLIDKQKFTKSLVLSLISSGVEKHSPLYKNPTTSVSNDICSVGNFEHSHTIFHQQIHKTDRINYLSVEPIAENTTLKKQYKLYPESLRNKFNDIENGRNQAVDSSTEAVAITLTQLSKSNETNNLNNIPVPMVSLKSEENTTGSLMTNESLPSNSVASSIISSGRRGNENLLSQSQEKEKQKNDKSAEHSNIETNASAPSSQNSMHSTSKNSKQIWKEKWLNELCGSSVYFSYNLLNNPDIHHVKDEFRKVYYVFTNIFKCVPKNSLDATVKVILLDETEREIEMSKEDVIGYFQTAMEPLSFKHRCKVWPLNKAINFIKNMGVDINSISANFSGDPEFVQHNTTNKSHRDAINTNTTFTTNIDNKKQLNVPVQPQDETLSNTPNQEISTIPNSNNNVNAIPTRMLNNKESNTTEGKNEEQVHDKLGQTGINNFKSPIDELSKVEDEVTSEKAIPHKPAEVINEGLEQKKKEKSVEKVSIEKEPEEEEFKDSEEYHDVEEDSEIDEYHEVEEKPVDEPKEEEYTDESVIESVVESDAVSEEEDKDDFRDNSQEDDYHDVKEHQEVLKEEAKDPNQEEPNAQANIPILSTTTTSKDTLKNSFTIENSQINAADSIPPFDANNEKFSGTFDKSEFYVNALEDSFVKTMKDMNNTLMIASEIYDRKSQELNNVTDKLNRNDKKLKSTIEDLDKANMLIETLYSEISKQQFQIASLHANIEEQQIKLKEERHKTKKAMGECIKALVENHDLKSQLETKKH